MSLPWKDPKWGLVNSLQVNGQDVKTDFTPAVIGFGERLYCIWVEQGTNKLKYAILNNDVWSSIGDVGLPNGQPEKALNSPSMTVLAGVIHMVYPDENRLLVHIQFDTVNNTWVRRYGILAKTSNAPCLAMFQSELHCVFRDGDANTLLQVAWSELYGWQKATQIRHPVSVAGREVVSVGQVAIFEFMARLQMLLVDKDSKVVGRYAKSANGSWEAVETKGPPKEAADSGVLVQCVNNIAFMACINKTGDSVVVSRIQDDAWVESQAAGAASKSSPAIAVLDNTVICVWNNRISAALQWKVRGALDIPPLDQWMSALKMPPTNYISALTIPGTHDAAAISTFPFVGCQTMGIRDQLMAGIRYFDIRAGFKSENLVAYHGGYAISGSDGVWSNIEIASLFTEFTNFLKLDAHKKEFLIVQIKQDPGINNPQAVERFGQAVKSLIEKSKDFWLTGADVPTLEKAWGKIQLMRRFPWNGELGIDAFTAWADNSDFFSNAKVGFSINIQDHFSWGTDVQCRANKFAVVKNQLERANTDLVAKNLYINFASGIAILRYIQSKDMAVGTRANPANQVNDYEGVNFRLRSFFNKAKAGRYGIILMDYPEEPEELLLAIIKTNFFGAPK